MYPALENGQWMFSDRFGTIERGDIITVKIEEIEGASIVKRVIGLPGEKIKILDNCVYINDQILEENYLTEEAKKTTSRGNYVCVEIRLEADEYYIMGDNRACSYDSRDFGLIKASNILYEQSTSLTMSFFHTSAIILLSFLLAMIFVVKCKKISEYILRKLE